MRRLQKESSVKVISYELNLARTTPSVRILAHKNGDIGYSDGVTVIANSINQVLSWYFFAKYQVFPSKKCQKYLDILLNEVKQDQAIIGQNLTPLPSLFSSRNSPHTWGGQSPFTFILWLTGPCLRRFRNI